MTPTRPVDPVLAEAIVAAMRAGASSLDEIATHLGQEGSNDELVAFISAMAIQGWLWRSDNGVLEPRDRSLPVADPPVYEAITAAAQRGADSPWEVAASLGWPLTERLRLVIGQVLYDDLQRRR